MYVSSVDDLNALIYTMALYYIQCDSNREREERALTYISSTYYAQGTVLGTLNRFLKRLIYPEALRKS